MQPNAPVKMIPVEADTFQAIGYSPASRKLIIQFRNAPSICYEGVPGFRYQGLMTAPRKDAYFKTYIKSRFLEKEVPPPMS